MSIVFNLAYAEDSYSDLPDIIDCVFKVDATLEYDIISKRFGAKSNTNTSFSFKIAGLSRGKPVIVGNIASAELQIVKNTGSVVYLIEDLQYGYNVMAIFLKTKKMSITKQYAASDGSPFVYSWVGEAIF